ncbi:MAG TPA: type 1 glutamine amidotransferase [Polyangiaceae bacterium]|nr:type 1 glutamine amidotransferase [Polyangiaceae bacterium]
MKALILQHAKQENAGRIAEALRARAIESVVVHTYAGEPVPGAVDGVHALVVMGGPMGVYEAERYPYLKDELRLIERALTANIPVLGICLGSQLLAHALGARVRKGNAKEIGWYPVELSERAATDPILTEAGTSFTPLHWHGDVFDLPVGAVPLARSALTAYQAFRYGAHAYGLLFHAEVTPAIVSGMARAFAGELAEVGLLADDLLAESPARIAALAPVAARIFERWAALSTAS